MSWPFRASGPIFGADVGETVQSLVAQAGGGFDASFFLMMGAMVFIVYFLMIRPQRKQASEHQQLLNALKKGDEVYLSSGFIGKVFAVDEKVVTVDLDKSTRVRVLKAAIAGRAGKMLGEGKDEKAVDKADKADKAEAEKAGDADEGAAEGGESGGKGGKKKKKTA